MKNSAIVVCHFFNETVGRLALYPPLAVDKLPSAGTERIREELGSERPMDAFRIAAFLANQGRNGRESKTSFSRNIWSAIHSINQIPSGHAANASEVSIGKAQLAVV